MSQTANPLAGYGRQTKISIPLPSRGLFYPPNFLELNNNDELDIKAMTASDDLSLKSPDALLNGQGMLDVIKSCVPGIKGDPSMLVVPDVTALMLAIRFASYGDTIDFKSTCPECNEINEFDRSIRMAIDTMTFLDDENSIELSNGLTLVMKPHDFKTSTKSNLAQFEQTKIMQLVDREEMADEEKIRTFANSFDKMVKMNFELVCDSVMGVQTPDGIFVKERKHIEPMVKELDTKEVDNIRFKIKSLNEAGVPNSQNCVCTHCQHEYVEENLTFDPSNFFD